MFEQLKEKCLVENLKLVEYGLVIFTWGNVSCIDRDKGVVAIKPSGVEYNTMTVNDIVVLDLATGEKVDGNLKPSSDAPTHLALYRNFKEIGGVVHTHSTYATSFAQAYSNIPAFGTTHADYFFGDIPCTREMTKQEIENDYEYNTGLVIAETIKKNKKSSENALFVPGIVVAGHGPFSWGKDANNAVHNAVVLEEIAKMATITMQINPNIKSLNENLLNKHFLRKHGANAYYGQ